MLKAAIIVLGISAMGMAAPMATGTPRPNHSKVGTHKLILAV